MNKTHKGYIAITTVLVLMVVTIGIAVTVAFLGIGGAQGSQSLTKGDSTLALVEGCTETALLNAQDDTNYNGGVLSSPEITCNITIDSKVGNDWTMTVSTTSTDYQRTIRTIFNRGTSIVLQSWQEI